MSLVIKKKIQADIESQQPSLKKLTFVVVPMVKDIEKQMSNYMIKIDITKIKCVRYVDDKMAGENKEQTEDAAGVNLEKMSSKIKSINRLTGFNGERR